MFIKEYLRCFKKAIPIGIIVGQVIMFFQIIESKSLDMKQFLLFNLVPIISLGYLFTCEYMYSLEMWSLKKKAIVQTILLVPLYLIYIKLNIIAWQIILVLNIIWIIIVIIRDRIRMKKDIEEAIELNKLLEKWKENN
ncbi:MAG: hypothetical protein ACRDDY_15400 [Clostridium sp.]|uniref:hypothetical protein n=1 Tax=Clostridium sp. TaxID=1506 RepID=UPI003EE6D2A6